MQYGISLIRCFFMFFHVQIREVCGHMPLGIPAKNTRACRHGYFLSVSRFVGELAGHMFRYQGKTQGVVGGLGNFFFNIRGVIGVFIG